MYAALILSIANYVRLSLPIMFVCSIKLLLARVYYCLELRPALSNLWLSFALASVFHYSV